MRINRTSITRLLFLGFLNISYKSSLITANRILHLYLKLIFILLILFLDETEREVKPVTSVRCPSPVLNTPWIPFQNYCYNFMIAKNIYMATTQDDVHSKCQKLSKYIIWSLYITLCSFRKISPEYVINISNYH